MIKRELRKAMAAALALSMALGTAGCGSREAGDGREAGAASGSTGENNERSGDDDGQEPYADVGKENGPEPDTAAGADSGRFRAAKDYQEVLAAFAASEGIFQYWALDNVGWAAADSGFHEVFEEAVSEPESTGSSGVLDTKDYSDTNVQVEGIAEGDVVKTDGDYIYVLSRRGGAKVFIVRAEESRLEFVSAVSLPDNGQYAYGEQMYISGNRLVIVRNGEKARRNEEAQAAVDWRRWYYAERQTEIVIYDITDRAAPELAAAHTQDGWYVSSREKDGYLYVISEKSVFSNYIQPLYDMTGNCAEEQNGAAGAEALSAEECARLPQADDMLLPPEDIYFCDQNEDSVYTIVTAVKLSEPEQITDSISFTAGSNHCYMSGNAIYLAAYDWSGYGEGGCDYTNIVRIAYEDGRLTLAAQGMVKGTLDDQFSMDEKDGYLRVVTTVNYYEIIQGADYPWQEYAGRSNSLYVLDAGLNVAGALENLAEDEMIYSARFLGDTAYFVTYRNMDPLFSVDLSDPENPVLLGALKIPGFSDYLHPFGDNLLLGIGYDAGDTDAATNYVKLTMFDITDPLNVVEKHTLILDGFSASEACYNHKSALVDKERGLIGFPAESYTSSLDDNGSWNYTEKKAYVVYGYDEESGFYLKLEKAYERTLSDRYGEVIVEDEWQQEEASGEGGGQQVQADAGAGTAEAQEDWSSWNEMQLRGIYIGDYFYTVSTTREAVSWSAEQGRFAEGMALELR